QQPDQGRAPSHPVSPVAGQSEQPESAGGDAGAGNGRIASASATAAVRMRCLGGFSLVIRGHTVDASSAKPMERALLHLLSMRAGEQVHREALIEAFWPDAEPDAGLHRLQVAISSLRRLIATDGEQPLLLAREGESYRLVLPEDADVDIWQVDAHLRRGALA